MKIMFIDESGDHNLDPDKVQQNYPIFVLVGCIFEEFYYKKTVVPKFNEFKKEFFGSDDIILHTLEHPYLLSFNFLLDECISELKEGQQSKIIAEKRNGDLDNQLELAWLNLKINGTEKNKGSDIKDKVENLYMIPKSANDPGLQIADLLANPIGRYVLEIKKIESGHEVEYEILKGKLRNGNLTVLPK